MRVSGAEIDVEGEYCEYNRAGNDNHTRREEDTE